MPNDPNDPKADRPDLVPHPLIEKIGANARMLAGYIGRTDKAGLVRLYPSLTNQSGYWEFEEKDILHAERATDMPLGGTCVWLRDTAKVSAHTVLKGELSVVLNEAAAIRRRQLRLNKETIGHLSSQHRFHPYQSGNMDCDSIFPVHCNPPDTGEIACTRSLEC